MSDLVENPEDRFYSDTAHKISRIEILSDFRQLKGGWPVLRTVPSQKVSRGEAHRLIDVATKILVATVSMCFYEK